MIKIIKLLSVLLFFTMALSSLTASGIIDNNSTNDIVTLSGRIKIKGSEPLIYITLVTNKDKDYILIGAKAEDLGTNYQLRMVEITGKIISNDAPPKSAEVEVISYKILN